MSDPLGHILGFYFADVLIESGNDAHDGPVGLPHLARNRNYLNVSNATYGLARPTAAAAARQSGYDMVDGENNQEERLDSDQMRKLEEVAQTLAKIGDNVNEHYKLPEWNPCYSFDSQIEGLLAGRVNQPDEQQIALVLRFAKDVLKTAVSVNKKGIVNSTQTYIRGHFTRWVSQYET